MKPTIHPYGASKGVGLAWCIYTAGPICPHFSCFLLAYPHALLSVKVYWLAILGPCRIFFFFCFFPRLDQGKDVLSPTLYCITVDWGIGSEGLCSRFRWQVLSLLVRVLGSSISNPLWDTRVWQDRIHLCRWGEECWPPLDCSGHSSF